MKRERLEILLNKYEKGECSIEELQELDEFYNKLDGEQELELPDYLTSDWEQFAQKEYQHLQTVLKQRKLTKKTISLQPYKMAAVLVGLLGFALLSIYLYTNYFYHAKQLPVVIAYKAEGTTDSNSRYVLLPDSSIVILHAGSILKMDSLTFNQKAREIELTGEAYFDIKHNTNKPFIVTAGKAKVTVLGTAFSVKTSAQNIEVTVTRGKVKVEEGKKQNIVTPNQQVVINAANPTQVKQVNADEQVKWIKTGLAFNNERIDSIAHKLQARYNIDVKLSNEELANCRVSAGSPFNGTESAEEILSLICPAINATYKKEGGTIVITGSGCNAQ